MDIARVPLKILWWPFKRMLKGMLKHPALKRYVVNRINESVDIPKLSEKQEEELFSAVVQAFIDFMNEM